MPAKLFDSLFPSLVDTRLVSILGVSNAPSLPSRALLETTQLFRYVSSIGVTSSSDLVSSWANAFDTSVGDAVNETADNQPTLDSTEIQFDGTNDVLTGEYNSIVGYKSSSFINLPDASGGDTGEGFTNTGIHQVSDGFWHANDGRGQNGDPYLPSLVKTGITDNNPNTTILEELTLHDLVTEDDVADNVTGTAQGVAVNSDETLIYVNTQVGNIREIYTSGVNKGKQKSKIAIPSIGGALTIDHSTGELLVDHTSNSTIRRVSVDGTVNSTFDPGISNIDHIHYNSDYGLLFITVSGGTVYVYNESEDSTSDAYDFNEVTQIEGICVDAANNKLHIQDDAYFHQSGTFKNRTVTYDIDLKAIADDFSGETRFAPGLDVSFVMSVSSNTGTDIFFSFDDPLAGDNIGLGFYVTSSTNIRIIGRNGGASVSHDFTVSNLSTKSIIRIVYDTLSETIEVFQNGTSVGSSSFGFTYFDIDDLFLGNGIQSRYSRVNFEEIVAYDRKMSSADASALDTRLKADWSIV